MIYLIVGRLCIVVFRTVAEVAGQSQDDYAPQNLRVDSRTVRSQVTLRWDAPTAFPDGYTVHDGYSILIKGPSDSEFILRAFKGASDRTHPMIGFDPDATYEFKVSAEYGSGYRDSTPITATTVGHAAGDPSIAGASIDAGTVLGQLTLTWPRVNLVTAYRVQWRRGS